MLSFFDAIRFITYKFLEVYVIIGLVFGLLTLLAFVLCTLFEKDVFNNFIYDILYDTFSKENKEYKPSFFDIITLLFSIIVTCMVAWPYMLISILYNKQ